MFKRIFLLALGLALVAGAAMNGVALADPPQKPVTESVSLNFTKVQVEYRKAGGDGGGTGKVFLSGNLHLVSQVTLDGNGMVTDVRLHANLSDAFVAPDLTADKKDCTPRPICCAIVFCMPVGAVQQDFMPTSPTNPAGLRVTFPLIFPLSGPDNGSENGIIAVLIGLRLDGSGKIASAEVISDTRGGGCLVPCLVGP